MPGTLNTLTVIISGNSTGLTRALGTASRDVQAFDNGLSRAGSGGRKALLGLATGATVAAIGLGYAVKSAAEFEAKMRNVSTIDSEVRGHLAQYSQSILAMSRELPQSANQLADGLYNISSSGFSGAESLQVLRASALAASAGLSTTEEAAKAIAAVINAYGLKAADATRVSDALFQTVNYGVINFEDLTGVIANTAGSAAAAGINIEQLGAGLATMTLSGLSASEAGVSMNRVLTSLIKPNKNLLAVQRDLGVSFAKELKDPAIGLSGVLDQLQKYVGGDQVAFSNLFTEVRASRGVLALTAAEGGTYSRILDKMSTAQKNAQATQNAFNEQAKGFSFQLRELGNRLRANAIDIGLKVLPVMTRLTQGAGEAAGVIGDGLGKAAQDLRPLWGQLVNIGRNVVEMFGDLYDEVGPVLAILAGAAWKGTVAGLTALGTAAEKTTKFLADNKEVVAALAVALTIAFLPAIGSAAAALGGALLSAIGRVALALPGLTTSILTMSPVLAGIGLVLGGLTFAYLKWGRSNRSTKVDVDALTDSVQKFIDTGKTDDLSKTILGQIADWKPSSNSKKGIEYLEDYKVNVAALVDQIADPRNKGALSDWIESLGDSGRDLKNGYDAYGDNAKLIERINESAKTGSPLIKQYAALFTQLLDPKNKVNPETTQGLIKSFLTLEGGIADTTTKLSDQKRVASDLGTAHGELAGRSEAVQKAMRDNASASEAWQNVLKDTHDSVKANIDVMQEQDVQYDVSAAKLQETVNKNLTLLQNQNADINTLISQGISGETIKRLYDMGPQYLHAAASNRQEANKLLDSSIQDGVKLTSDGIDLLAQALNPAKFKAAQDAKTRQDYVLFVESVQTSTAKALEIVNAYSTVGLPAELAGPVQANQAKALEAYLATLDAPLRQAVLTALGSSRSGAASVAGAITAAIVHEKPTAATQADALYRAVQDNLNKLTSKQVDVIMQDLASGNIQGVIDKLGGLRSAIGQLPGGFFNDFSSLGGTTGVAAPNANPYPLGKGPGAATGGVAGMYTLPGRDPLGKDDAGLFRLNKGETVIRSSATNLYGPHKMQAVSQGRAIIQVPGMATGGVYDYSPAQRAAASQAAARAPLGDLYTVNLTTAPLGRAADAMGRKVDALTAWIKELNSVAWPVPGFTGLSQPYGGAGGHPGIDIPAPLFTPIVAAFSGQVTDAGPAGGFGNWVRINHPQRGIGTTYGHMQGQTITVHPGQTVAAGTHIAGVGSEGQSTGPHLHFEVHVGGVNGGTADPMGYLRGAGTVLASSMAFDGPKAAAVKEPFGLGAILGGVLGMAGGGVVPGTGGPAEDAQKRYLEGLATQKYLQGLAASKQAAGGNKVNDFLTAMKNNPVARATLAAQLKAQKSKDKAQAAALKKFVETGKVFEPGKTSLAIAGMQDVYRVPGKHTGRWDQKLTDYIAVHEPTTGARGMGVRFLEMALGRPVNGVADKGDLGNLYGKLQSLVGQSGYAGIINDDRKLTAFNGWIQQIVSRGFPALADKLNTDGVSTAYDTARQLAGAPRAYLQRAQDAVIRTSQQSKYGDALHLSTELARLGRGTGLLKLSSRSGTSVADALGLVTSYPDIFRKLGATSSALFGDLARIGKGLQPIPGYASGAYRITQDHVAMVHRDETIVPARPAEAWRQGQSFGGGGGVAVTVANGAVQVTVGAGADVRAIRREVGQALDQAVGKIVAGARQGTGRV